MNPTPLAACPHSKSAPSPSGPAHGGALGQARRLFPGAPEPFLDLSTGINPIPYTFEATRSGTSDLHARLPEPDDEASLRAIAATAYGVSNPDMIAAAPGTQILISLLPFLLARLQGRVAILSPTYGEHAQSWRHAGHTVHETAGIDDLAAADIAVLCNPNNPDGRRIAAADILILANRMQQRAGLLIVDESFADLEPPGLTAAAHLPHPALLILRSFGKTYGLAGLRLGFALAAPETAAHLRGALGPWAISGIALAIGRCALADTAWRERTIRHLQADADRLDALAQTHGLALIGGTRLFRLYSHPQATAIHRTLGHRGVLVRRFETHPTRLRVGLPGTAGDWARLESALANAHTAPHTFSPHTLAP